MNIIPKCSTTPVELDPSFDQVREDEIEQLLKEESENEIDQILDDDPIAHQASYELTPSEFTEFAIRIPVGGKFDQFSFANRRYLRPIYDAGNRRTLLFCSRQTEKCNREIDKVLTPCGAWRMIRDMNIGDKIVSLRREGTIIGWAFEIDEVVDKFCIGEERSYNITTRMGSSITVSDDTPLLAAKGWVKARNLQVKDRVAAARRLGEAAIFGQGWGSVAGAELCGICIADGYLSTHEINITKKDPHEREYIAALAEKCDQPYTIRDSANSAPKVIIKKCGPIYYSMQVDGLIGKLSADKFVPFWIFTDANREETIAFIRGLWRCDGSISRRNPTLWDIVYATISKQLAQQVRELLLKLGIPSRIRANHHKAYKDDPDKDQYLVRVETLEGVRTFLKDIMDDLPDDMEEYGDSNRDTYPLEIITPLIKRIFAKLELGTGRGDNKGEARRHKLYASPKYPISRRKLKKYIDMFVEVGIDPKYPAYSQLLSIFNGDVIWDQIVSIEDIGQQKLYHLSIKKNHNYLHEGIVTHNSTTLGNKSLAYCAINVAFKVLYVSATAQQAQTFSVDRLKEPMATSKELSFIIDPKLNQNVFFKQFRNFSQIRIRYAFLSADRCRGISADLINIDELQDIATQNIPIIEQCASHSQYKLYCYSGTPKSFDNTIEHYWSNFSTQNEWVVPCDRHGLPKQPNTWHWNVLGVRNIGKDGLVCAKCSKPINPMHPNATWAALQPITDQNATRVTFNGYRINQLMVPWIDWRHDIVEKFEREGTAEFYNETLGLSYDSGQRPLTRITIESICKEEIHFNDVIKNAAKCSGGVFAGIDWGTGEQASYTVLSLGGYIGGTFQIFYVHRFVGEDLTPQLQLEKIAKLLISVSFKIAGADYGGGFDRNDWLMRNFGPMKFVKYQYSYPKQKIKWQPKLCRYMVHKTEVMSDIFNAIKRKKISLPNWNEYADPYGNDLLNIYSEYSKQLHMIRYDVSHGKSDDAFHSLLYCLLASMLVHPRPDIIIPYREGDVSFR